jgi:hypothetical protein
MPALMWTTVPPAKSTGPTAAVSPPSPSSTVPKIIDARLFSEWESSPPPHTMWASGKYARVTHTPANANQVPNRTRSAMAPEMSATVMMANVTWNATSTTCG